MFKRKDIEATKIWSRYEKIKEQHNISNLNNKSERCWDFFNGRQWRGIACEEELPFMNIIQPTIEYKVATVAQQDMSITYSPMSSKDNLAEYQAFCDILNDYAKQQWELLKMDVKTWEVVKDGCVAGDSYIYFYDDKLNAQIIDNINVFLADEQQTDIQKQKFIIIYERRNVIEVRQEAEKNGIKETDLIVADDDTDNLNSEAKNEVKSESDGKCSCLLMLSKSKQGIVSVTRSTKNVIYQKETPIYSQNEIGNKSVALRIYPIANFIWSKKKGSARGIGEVEQLIPNQIAINKNLARREEAIKQFAFPKMAYIADKIANADDIDEVGAKIIINDTTAQSVKDIITFLNPQQLSSDAKQLNDELITNTRELAGAGDSALGNIDPTKASGTAIIAVKDQSAIPLNEQVATLKQFIEDIALIWYQLWIVYNPQGLDISTEEGGMIIPNEIMQQMKVNIKIDVAPNNPFSKYAQQQALDNLFQSGAIQFEEYVEALDDNSSIPKGRLQDIINKRTSNVPNEIIQELQNNPELLQTVVQLVAQTQQQLGGVPDGMQ